MNETEKKELVVSARKFAQKNTFCLYLTIIYITARVFGGLVKKYFGIYIYKFTGLAAIFAAFIFLGSIMPVTILNTTETSVDVSPDYTTGEENRPEFNNEVQTQQKIEEEWSEILINKTHKIPDDYIFELGTIDGNMKCDSRVIGPLKQMIEDARNQGIELDICSPYRNEKRQEYLFRRKVKGYERAGASYMDSYKLASTEVTVPGSSEHEIGLAFDIVGRSYGQLDEGFAKSPEGIWLRENSYLYGFILRYPENKEEITGISFEPWHFRYVGIKAAQIIKENNITLEEYTEGLNNG